MSYTKNTWTNGDTITAEKLNNMENGIANAGGTLIVGVTVTTDENENERATMDKTWQEIHDALAAGLRVIIIQSGSDYLVQDTIYHVYFSQDYGYEVNAMGREGELEFYAENPSDYPVFVVEPA